MIGLTEKELLASIRKEEAKKQVRAFLKKKKEELNELYPRPQYAPLEHRVETIDWLTEQIEKY